MVSHGFSWILMVSHDFSWFLMVSHGFSWILMVSHVFLWFLMVSHGFSCVLMCSRVFFVIFGVKMTTSDPSPWFWAHNPGFGPDVAIFGVLARVAAQTPLLGPKRGGLGG